MTGGWGLVCKSAACPVSQNSGPLESAHAGFQKDIKGSLRTGGLPIGHTYVPEDNNSWLWDPLGPWTGPAPLCYNALDPRTLTGRGKNTADEPREGAYRMAERGKRPFNPKAHAAVYGAALLYLGYLLARLIADAVNGGPSAPSPLILGVGLAVLGIAFVVVAVLTWRMFHMKVDDKDGESDREE